MVTAIVATHYFQWLCISYLDASPIYLWVRYLDAERFSHSAILPFGSLQSLPLFQEIILLGSPYKTTPHFSIGSIDLQRT